MIKYLFIKLSSLGLSEKDPESLSWALLEGLNRKWDSTTILEHAKKYSWSELAKQILMTYQKALNRA